MSPTSSTPDVLVLLLEQYEAVPAPAPSAELLTRMDAGRVGSVFPTDGEDADDHGATVVPFAPRAHARLRLRYLIAATLAAFVAMSGLAVAGELPDSLQRRVASVASEFGINLPNPDSGSTPADGSGGNPPIDPGTSGANTNGAGSDSSGSNSAGGAADTGTTPTTSLRGSSVVGGGASLTVPPTTLPPTDGVPKLPPAAPPILSVPPVTVPSISLPPLNVPPLNVPPLPLPSISLPPLNLPPISLPALPLPGLPGLPGL